MIVMASQITNISIVCSTVCSGAYQRKHQSSTSLAFVRGIHRWPVDSPHKGPVTRKMFPFADVIVRLFMMSLNILLLWLCEVKYRHPMDYDTLARKHTQILPCSGWLRTASPLHWNRCSRTQSLTRPIETLTFPLLEWYLLAPTRSLSLYRKDMINLQVPNVTDPNHHGAHRTSQFIRTFFYIHTSAYVFTDHAIYWKFPLNQCRISRYFQVERMMHAAKKTPKKQKHRKNKQNYKRKTNKQTKNPIYFQHYRA